MYTIKKSAYYRITNLEMSEQISTDAFTTNATGSIKISQGWVFK
ncbi:MAG: hypothetical protein ACOWWH_11375 [Eubacteriaceae bacterium]